MGGDRVEGTAGPGDPLQLEPHVARLAEHATGDPGASGVETLFDRLHEHPVGLRVPRHEEHRAGRLARLQHLPRDRGAGTTRDRVLFAPGRRARDQAEEDQHDDRKVPAQEVQ